MPENMNEKVFFKTNNYNELNDEEIIELIEKGDENAYSFILNKYKELVNLKVAKYYIIGAEKDDIIQEGMIGLFKAIKGYNKSRQNSFKTFANLCIERQLITAIKNSNRQKHKPLNFYLSLNNSKYENEEDGEEFINTFDSKTIEDPLDTVMKKEYMDNLEAIMETTLSKFEKQVLSRYVKGESYVDIASQLDSTVKSVDNAIQRIRKKAIKSINDN